MPGIGPRYEPDDPVFEGVRFSSISRFKKYLVFYRPIEGGIERRGASPDRSAADVDLVPLAGDVEIFPAGAAFQASFHEVGIPLTPPTRHCA